MKQRSRSLILHVSERPKSDGRISLLCGDEYGCIKFDNLTEAGIVTKFNVK
jgi:hypothetical protein